MAARLGVPGWADQPPAGVDRPDRDHPSAERPAPPRRAAAVHRRCAAQVGKPAADRQARRRPLSRTSPIKPTRDACRRLTAAAADTRFGDLDMENPDMEGGFSMATTGATTSIEAAVQEFLDKEAIRDVIIRLCRGSDRNLQELAESCYHPEAVDDHGIYNGPALEFFTATAESRARTLAVHHHLGQMNIEIDGDTAVCETSCIATMVIPGED